MYQKTGFLLIELGISIVILSTLFCSLTVGYGYAVEAQKKRITTMKLAHEVRSYIDYVKSEGLPFQDRNEIDQIGIKVERLSSAHGFQFYSISGYSAGEEFSCITGSPL